MHDNQNPYSIFPRLSNESYKVLDSTMCDLSYIDARRGTDF